MIRLFLILGLLSFYLKSFSRDYDAELISQKTSIIISKGNLIKNKFYEIRINNRAGEKYAKITIPYSKLNKLKNIEALIKDSNGRIVKRLKKNEISTRSSISDFSFYEDNFEKEFILKHNSYPYTIVYSYQIQQSEFLYIDYWTPVMDEDVPTLSSDLLVSVPLDYGISYLNHHIESCSIDTLADKINYHWSASYTDLIKSEAFSPPVFDIFPSVQIIPLHFRYEEEGSFEDWISFGNWQFKLLRNLNELPDFEKNKISKLIKDVDEDKEKIKILYHYLQDETRYINVSIETGGLKPYPASYVAQNKYGDCKALTNYFKSILDYIQIPSFYTKVYAGNPNKEIDKNFPSQQSNHVILYVPLNDEDIWLDCTSDGAFNYLGTFTQNRDAFIIDYNNSSFKKTPVLKPKDVLVSRKIETKYDTEIAKVKFQNTYRGDSYQDILSIEQSFNEKDKARIIRNYIVDDGFQLIDYQIIKQNRDSVSINLIYEASTQNIYKKYGNDILIKNIAFSIPGFEKPENRKSPVQIDYPLYKRDTIIYEIPFGYKLHKSEDIYTLGSKYGEYELYISENENNIMVIKSLLIFPGFYPVSEYDNFYEFYRKVIETENKTHLSLHK